MILKMLEWAIIKGFEGVDHFSPRGNNLEGELSPQIVLGTAIQPFNHNRWEQVILDTRSRLHHLYILGSTGSGKTKFIESLVRQDMMSQNGFCLIDPHGDLIQSLFSYLAENFQPSQLEKLGRKFILIEPFNRNWAIGFNPLEAVNGHFPAMLEIVEILKRFWSSHYWGPRMDELLRHTIITLCQNNLTLLEARPLLAHHDFRQRLIQNISYPEVRDYWIYRYGSLSERMQTIYREPVLNKISAFITDPSIYRIVCQSRSTINFRQSMDQGKWIFINLSKGHLRENIRLLGTLLLTKIKQAALSRIDTPEINRRPFFLFVDEFQHFVGENFEEILSEARKFRLGLTIAHQNLDQLPRELRSAILGNVGTEIFFRLSHHDAAQISSEMDQKERHLIERRLIDLKVREAYLKIKGQKPRLLKTPFVPPVEISEDAIERIRLASFRNWARSVNEVEREIEERRNLWVSEGIMNRSPLRESRMRSVKDYLPFAPEGLFEEGQSEW